MARVEWRINPHLKDFLGDLAEEAGDSLSEFLGKLAIEWAELKGLPCPKDWAKIPRKPQGRPRKRAVPA